VSICKSLVPCKELFSSACGVTLNAGVEELRNKNLTNIIVFGDRLRSASRGDTTVTGVSGPGTGSGHRAKRNVGTGAPWY
jgi:hypothetical protein